MLSKMVHISLSGNLKVFDASVKRLLPPLSCMGNA